ncbi:N-carbamoyl-L-amino-acid hydrolase [compost metagenome]
MSDEIERRVPGICDNLGVGYTLEHVGAFEPVSFDESLAHTVRQVAQRLAYSNIDMISGAGHDACWISKIAPTIMIFCPCVGGISHNEAEDISPEWAAAGANVLLHAVLETVELV